MCVLSSSARRRPRRPRRLTPRPLLSHPLSLSPLDLSLSLSSSTSSSSSCSSPHPLAASCHPFAVVPLVALVLSSLQRVPDGLGRHAHARPGRRGHPAPRHPPLCARQRGQPRLQRWQRDAQQGPALPRLRSFPRSVLPHTVLVLVRAVLGRSLARSLARSSPSSPPSPRRRRRRRRPRAPSSPPCSPTLSLTHTLLARRVLQLREWQGPGSVAPDGLDWVRRPSRPSCPSPARTPSLTLPRLSLPLARSLVAYFIWSVGSTARLPRTPRTPRSVAAHYFDEVATPGASEAETSAWDSDYSAAELDIDEL